MEKSQKHRDSKTLAGYFILIGKQPKKQGSKHLKDAIPSP